MSKRVAITGASGLIGGALSALLTAGATRSSTSCAAPRTAAEIRWDPARGSSTRGALDGVDAVVHLAGAGVGDHRWTPAYKQEILPRGWTAPHARVGPGRAAGRGQPVLVSASAVGYYGPTGATRS